jgi:hypothetical protein
MEKLSLINVDNHNREREENLSKTMTTINDKNIMNKRLRKVGISSYLPE